MLISPSTKASKFVKVKYMLFKSHLDTYKFQWIPYYTFFKATYHTGKRVFFFGVLLLQFYDTGVIWQKSLFWWSQFFCDQVVAKLPRKVYWKILHCMLCRISTNALTHVLCPKYWTQTLVYSLHCPKCSSQILHKTQNIKT